MCGCVTGALLWDVCERWMCDRGALLWDVCERWSVTEGLCCGMCDRGCVDEWMCDVERSLLHHCVVCIDSFHMAWLHF